MSGGERSFFGFEYQIQASVLFLLQECTKPEFQNMVIETAFGHDAGISLMASVENINDSDHTLSAKFRVDRTIWIQIKTRNRNNEWRPSDIRDLLLKTDEQNNDKQTLLKTLSNEPNSIFVFMTDGIISSSLAPLIAHPDLTRKAPTLTYQSIRELLYKSDRKSEFQANFADFLSDNLLDRVYLIENLGSDLIRLRAREILHDHFSISYHETDSKVSELNELVRQRMLRIENSDSITKQNVEAIIGKHRGQIPYPFTYERFVGTDTYLQAENLLANKHFLVVVGEPGVGKTSLAQAIINKYVVELKYKLATPRVDSAHHEILQIVREPGDQIIFVDDAFGIDQLDPNCRLHKYLDAVTESIINAKGRVKLIVTTRQSVLKAALHEASPLNQLFDNFIINPRFPSRNLVIEIIKKHLALTTVDAGKIEGIIKALSNENFENLVHVRYFINEISSVSEISSESINEIFEKVRPSSYRTWLDKQSDESRMLMFMLWGLIRANHYARERDLKLVFELACECLELKKQVGFLSSFDAAKNLLLNQQERIIRYPNGTLNFVHPSLLIAVGEYFVKYQDGAANLVESLCKHLIEQPGSVLPSLAAILLITFRHAVEHSYKDSMLKLLNSQYILVRETILRHAGNSIYSLLGNIDPSEERVEKTEVEKNFRYDIYDCKFDENGELILKDSAQETIHHASYYIDKLNYEYDLRKGKFETELEQKINKAMDAKQLNSLNPIERYQFGYWLQYLQQEPNTPIPQYLVDELSNDPYHFVRETVVNLISVQTYLSNIYYRELFRHIVKDAHPNVKIAIINKIVFPNWTQLPESIQEEWLNFVPNLLDHPFVRREITATIVGQSENENEEFYAWTPEQKQRWLTLVTESLLRYEFEYNIDFDRVLSAFDEFFIKRSSDQRTELLNRLGAYVHRFPRYTYEISSTIEFLLFSGNPNRKELDAISEMITNFTAWGRCRFSYTFARNLEKIDDDRLLDFVARPFFNESPSDFLPERVASVLGFLANPTLTHQDLPSIILNQAKDNDSPHSLVERYASQQDVDFKVLLVLMAYQHERVHHIPAINDASEHPFVLSQFTELLKSGDFNIQMLMVDLLLKNIRAISPELVEWKGQPVIPLLESKWFKIFQQFLYNNNDKVARIACELIIANSIHDITPNIRIAASLIYLALSHPNVMVAEYAFHLFDTHFARIWKRITTPRLPEDWKIEISRIWGSSDFREQLWNNSVAFKMYFMLNYVLSLAQKQWSSMPDAKKDELVDHFHNASLIGGSHLVEIVESFLTEFADQLTEEQLNTLTISIKTGAKWGLQEIEDAYKFQSVFPKVDWSRYFPEH